MSLQALFLNCTLKKSPEPSNTRALIDKVAAHMQSLGAETEVVRVVDYDVRFGVTSEAVDDGDAWPKLLDKVKAADVLVLAMPIWMGTRSSVCQMVVERLDGTLSEADEDNGQYPLYNKVAGVIVTGNEDGAHDCAANTLFNLTHLGCTVPPNADSYYVGKAGPGPSYIDADADHHVYTDKTARFMAHNLVYFARLLQENPIPTNLRALTEAAEAYGEAG